MTITAPETALVPGLFAFGPDGAPHLCAARCPACGELAFPARAVCARCKRRGTERAAVGAGATLFSFTVCHAAPAGWQAPYLQAYVELPERLRVFTLVASAVEPRADALTVGEPMDLVVEPVRPGAEILTYKFAPRR
jgi:uncharacterized OB-fold protein